MRAFPPDFLFGCATSAYQVEGGIENDWTVWEAAGRLKDPRARCGRATDHWNRWEEDFDRLASLGARAYRMSVEWARVEPRPGAYDQGALDRYARMIDGLRARGIEPFVTLLHFTHPTWFHEASPWHAEGDGAAGRFADFAGRVARQLGDRVTYWTVLNEPSVWLTGAHLAGVIPPGVKSLRALGRAFVKLVKGHARAAAAIRAAGAHARIGIAHNVIRFAPSRAGFAVDRVLAHYVGRQFNHAFIDALVTGRAQLGAVPGVRVLEEVPEAKGSLDFLGVNYYSRVFVEARPSLTASPVHTFYEDRRGLGVSDLGWEIFPEGLTELLLEMGRYGLPMYVTENGIDDRDDSRRAAYLHDHLSAVLDAREKGADVRGYLFWSLLDNFEWLEAWGPRFGLYRTDFETLARTPTRGADLFRYCATERRLPRERPPSTIKPGTQRTPTT